MKIRGAYRLKKTWIQLNRQGVVLMYHRVANLKHDPWKLSVTPEHFDQHMHVLKKYAQPVQISSMGTGLHRFPLGRKKVAVTFDDGYADNFHQAKPILEKHHVPATFFIVSGAINKREEFWWDDLERIILAAKVLPKTFELTINGTHYVWPIVAQAQNTIDYSQMNAGLPLNNTALSQKQLYSVLWQLVGTYSFPDKKKALQQIAQWSGQGEAPRPNYLPMTSQELTSLAASPLFEIGGHTVCHPILSRLTPEEQEKEIAGSKRELENALGKPVTSFSYPHGAYNSETLKIVQQLKLQAACTVQPQAIPRNQNPHLLPRFTVFDWDGNTFEQHLQKWLTDI